MGGPEIAFEDLGSADLPAGAICIGGTAGNYADEAIHHVAPVGIQGGIRYKGTSPAFQLVVLYSTLQDDDWPDRIDPETGTLTYYGDNRTAGNDLLDTAPGGNSMLRELFSRGFGSPSDRAATPPFLVFSKPVDQSLGGWSREFRGVAVPGADGVATEDWLVAKWFDRPQGRFENYVLTMTILDIPLVPRHWVNDALAGEPTSESCPSGYRRWVETGHRQPLVPS